MSRFYCFIISSVDRFVPNLLRPFWESETGPKTIFFWAPLMKWGLIFAGFSDFNRPTNTISIPQSAALAASGLIWSRYCLVIKPVNYSLMSANMLVAGVNLYQLTRFYKNL